MNQDLISKARVLATALPSYLAVATLILTVVAAELVPLLPGGLGTTVGGWIVTALLVIAALVRTVSRLTPADPSTYGLLPSPQGQPVDGLAAPRDAGSVPVGVLFALTLLVILIVIFLPRYV